MDFSLIDFQPIWLSLQLAGVTVLILLALATPVAWWLAHTRCRFRVVVEAVVALPLVLPPTVLGFYMLILLGPNGWVGGPVQALTGSALSFSFAGLVFASCLYSLPLHLSEQFADGAAYWYWSAEYDETDLTDCCTRIAYFVTGRAFSRNLSACTNGGVRAVRGLD